MTADNIIFGVDFKAKQERCEQTAAVVSSVDYDVMRRSSIANQIVIGDRLSALADTSPCETNPQPYVVPDNDCA